MNSLTRAEIKQWRQEFPLLATTVHLANCSQAPQAKRVRTAIEAYLKSWREDGMNWELWLSKVQTAKEQFAKLINADVDEIAVTMSVSDATASIASALELNPERRRILTTAAEFPAVGQIWLAQQRMGWQVDFVPVRDGELRLEDFDWMINPQTALVSATHVYYQNGSKIDLSELAKIAHSRGALLYVDAYQSLGTVPVDVRRQQIDILSSGVLKYLLGIPGIAFLYVRREVANQLRPAVTGWFGQENPFSFEATRLTYAQGARRFETGTPPIISAYAAEAGLSIINEVGIDRIHQRVMQLVDQTIRGALNLDLPVMGANHLDRRGAAVAIAVNDSHAVEEKLKEQGIIASARGPAIRLAPHFFTVEENIEQALTALRKLV